ncbi:hypothetical protein [Paenibacillus sp.]|nr:hypothetical protein [Paenibacillus sp.]
MQRRDPRLQGLSPQEAFPPCELQRGTYEYPLPAPTVIDTSIALRR